MSGKFSRRDVIVICKLAAIRYGLVFRLVSSRDNLVIVNFIHPGNNKHMEITLAVDKVSDLNRLHRRICLRLVDCFDLAEKDDKNFCIKNVIFNKPATIVFWEDGTKTVVKAQDGEKFDPEKGLAMAISKKAFGNNRDYYEVFKEWCPEETKRPEKVKEDDLSDYIYTRRCPCCDWLPVIDREIGDLWYFFHKCSNYKYTGEHMVTKRSGFTTREEAVKAWNDYVLKTKK